MKPVWLRLARRNRRHGSRALRLYLGYHRLSKRIPESQRRIVSGRGSELEPLFDQLGFIRVGSIIVLQVQCLHQVGKLRSILVVALNNGSGPASRNSFQDSRTQSRKISPFQGKYSHFSILGASVNL